MKKNMYIQPSVEVTAQLYRGVLCASGEVDNDPLAGGGGIGGDEPYDDPKQRHNSTAQHTPYVGVLCGAFGKGFAGV